MKLHEKLSWFIETAKKHNRPDLVKKLLPIIKNHVEFNDLVKKKSGIEEAQEFLKEQEVRVRSQLSEAEKIEPALRREHWLRFARHQIEDRKLRDEVDELKQHLGQSVSEKDETSPAMKTKDELKEDVIQRRRSMNHDLKTIDEELAAEKGEEAPDEDYEKVNHIVTDKDIEKELKRQENEQKLKEERYLLTKAQQETVQKLGKEQLEIVEENRQILTNVENLSQEGFENYLIPIAVEARKQYEKAARDLHIAKLFAVWLPRLFTLGFTVFVFVILAPRIEKELATHIENRVMSTNTVQQFDPRIQELIPGAVALIIALVMWAVGEYIVTSRFEGWLLKHKEKRWAKFAVQLTFVESSLVLYLGLHQPTIPTLSEND